MNNYEKWIALSILSSEINGIGPKIFTKIRQETRDDFEVLKKIEKQNSMGIIPKQVKQELFKVIKNLNVEKQKRALEIKNVRVLTQFDKNYPQKLLTTPDAPICLYIKGDLDFDFNTQVLVGVVGSRTPTNYGIEVTKKLSSELATAGVVVTSGLALGVDALAHSAALGAGCKTVAVLGCGVDVAYPSSNSKIYNQIVSGGGVVISEYYLGIQPNAGLFINRNRIIAGISDGVLITEGKENSGALITAQAALEEGRDVFATPAPITSSLSVAPNNLLKQGAHVVTKVEDILEVLGVKTQTGRKIDTSTMTALEKKIIEILLQESLSADDIAAEINTDIPTLTPTLSLLEMSGYVAKTPSGLYAISTN